MGIAAKTRHLGRYAELGRLLVKYGRSDLVREMGLDHDPELQAGTRDGRGAEAGGDEVQEAKELARDLEALGPTYVKLGQLLSTRMDLLPPAYTEALTRLQDDVEPISCEEVERVFEEEIGVDPGTAFETFDRVPLASASLSQVHRARLRSGRDVVVKVQRPGIRDRIRDDMEALGELAHFLDGHTEVGRRFGFAELLGEFDRTLRDELDFRREAANLVRLAEIVRPYPLLVVPQPVPDMSAGRVLTMDYIAGRKVTDLRPLGRMDLDGCALAQQLFQAYLDQILVEGFFHADPHPGNVSLTPDGRLALLDLGMVARVSPELQDSLVKLLIAVSGGRGEQAARVAIEMGKELEHFDPEAFTRGASDLVVRNHNLGMSEIDSGTLVMQLSRLSAECGLRLPPELSLLAKALLNLDQVSRTLDPSFEPSAAIQSHATSIMESRMKPTRERLFSAALETREMLEELPGRVNKIMDTVARGELKLKVDAFDEAQLIRGLHKLGNRVTMGLVLAALIIGAAMLMQVETESRLFGYPALAIVSFLLASLGAVALLWTIVVGDRRTEGNARRR